MALSYAGYIVRWDTVDYRARVLAEAIRIKADGCSGVPDFFLVVCDEHDIHYAGHRDFYTGALLTQEHADQMLQWGIQYFSWFGRWSPMAWWRYRALSREKGLGLGRASWDTGPQRLRDRLGT